MLSAKYHYYSAVVTTDMSELQPVYVGLIGEQNCYNNVVTNIILLKKLICLSGHNKFECNMLCKKCCILSVHKQIRNFNGNFYF